MKRWRWPLALVALALATWFGYAIWHAGDDVPPPSTQAQTDFGKGHAEGRRLKFPAWTMDYDKIETSTDGSVATLEHVRDGRYFKNGKPAMKLKADHVVINLVTNDFVATGQVDVKEIDGKHDRHFSSAEADYAGITQMLILNRPSTIFSDGTTLRVATATINFRSGDVQLGRIVGVR